MAEMLAATMALFGGGAAAAGSVAVPGIAGAATLTPAVAGGVSLASILQGGATVMGLVSSIASGAAEKEQMDLAAADAEAEQAMETLKGVDRQRSLKAAAAEAIGEIDTAHAASGVDLSFGTARQARQSALRETDLGLTTDAGTTMTRLSRLRERAANYRRMGKRRLMAGVIGGIGGALGNAANMAGR